MNALYNILAVGAGSCLGGVVRYIASRCIRLHTDSMFPWETFAVNVSGCLIIGIIYGLLDRGFQLSIPMKLFLTVGFCGGFTTFSTFMNESYLLLKAGRQLWMLTGYIAASLTVGFLLLWLGYRIATFCFK